MAAFGPRMFCIVRSDSFRFALGSFNESFNNLCLPWTAGGDSGITQLQNISLLYQSYHQRPKQLALLLILRNSCYLPAH
jgi:hypothetical protein